MTSGPTFGFWRLDDPDPDLAVELVGGRVGLEEVVAVPVAADAPVDQERLHRVVDRLRVGVGVLAVGDAVGVAGAVEPLAEVRAVRAGVRLEAVDGLVVAIPVAASASWSFQATGGRAGELAMSLADLVEVDVVVVQRRHDVGVEVRA